MKFDTTQQLIESFRRGEMVVLVDDEDHRLGGVLLAPADDIDADRINFMVRQARGLVCLGLTAERCARLQLPLMVTGFPGSNASRFTVSIEAAEGISTGISAADRAHTIRVAVAQGAQARDVVQPGHIFPLRAEPGGVLKRAGHTEGGCDLARLAGYEPAAVMVDVLNGDGTLATGEALFAFARRHGLRVGTIAGLIQFRLQHETTVRQIRDGVVQTAWGPFHLHVFRDIDDTQVHLALVRGKISTDALVLVRVQQIAALRDVLGAEVPGSAPDWNAARCLERIAQEGSGVLVLLTQREAEEQLLVRVGAVLGDAAGAGTLRPPDALNMIGVGSQILRQLDVGRMRLMGPSIRYNAISGFGLEIVEYLGYQAE